MVTEEKTLDLKSGDATPAEAGQSEQKTAEPDTQVLESEIDGFLKDAEEEEGDEDDDDETVTLSKKEVTAMKKASENYKKGLLSLKDKLKAFKKHTPVAKDTTQGQSAGDKPDLNKPVTHADLIKERDSVAIKEACTDQDIDKNWKEIVGYYTPRRGKQSVAAIVADIKDAHTLWRKEHPAEDGADDATSRSNLASDKSNITARNSGGAKKEIKSLFPKKVPVQQWYPKPKET